MSGGGIDPTDLFDARAVLEPGRPLEVLDHLMIAVVDHALREYRLHGRSAHPRRQAWFENARAFLFDADADADWPITFERACDRFGVDVDAARAAIVAKRGSRRRVRLRSRRPIGVETRVPSRKQGHQPPLVYAWEQLCFPFRVSFVARPTRDRFRMPRRRIAPVVTLELRFDRRRARTRRAA
jgi:hypothetical protein